MTSPCQVVGMKSSEKQQAQSLKLLLTIMTRCPEYARDFRSFGGHAMLSKVLASTACKLSCYILKVSLLSIVTLPFSDVNVDEQTLKTLNQSESSSASSLSTR